jgi:hypothetical protein
MKKHEKVATNLCINSLRTVCGMDEGIIIILRLLLLLVV